MMSRSKIYKAGARPKKEQRIYNAGLDLTASTDTKVRSLGKKFYEQTNHLGNVLQTIKDKKTPIPSSVYYNEEYFETTPTSVKTQHSQGLASQQINGTNCYSAGFDNVDIGIGDVVQVYVDSKRGGGTGSIGSLIIEVRSLSVPTTFAAWTSYALSNNTTGFTTANKTFTFSSAAVAGPYYTRVFCYNASGTPLYVDNMRLTVTHNSTVQNFDHYAAVVTSNTDYYAFGSPMPARTANEERYRYNFNGKESDNEVSGTGNEVDYGMRVNDTRLGRFFSVDPLTSKYAELTPYQFASNTPIQAIDLDGLEAFFIHGTWGDNGAWVDDNGKPKDIVTFIEGVFGNKSAYVPGGYTRNDKEGSWSGGNSDEARQQAAREMVQYIKDNRKDGEPITIIGHSHGGNVGVLVANMLSEDPDFEDAEIILLTMNTPVREYQLSPTAVNHVKHYHLYNTKDGVQVLGGNNLFNVGSGNSKMSGEYGVATRQFPHAVNIEYNSPYTVFNVYGNHQGWRPGNMAIWGPQLAKAVQDAGPAIEAAAQTVGRVVQQGIDFIRSLFQGGNDKGGGSDTRHFPE